MKPLSKRFTETTVHDGCFMQYARLELFYELDPQYTSVQDLPQILEESTALTYLQKYLKQCRISLDSQEKFFVMFLNRNNRLLSINLISIGLVNCTLVDLKQITKIALDVGSTAIIAIHNHPSGNMRPSNQDIYITKRMKCMLKLCDIELVDHLIISSDVQVCYSMSRSELI